MEKYLILDKLKDLKVSLESENIEKGQLIVEFKKLVELYFQDNSTLDIQLIKLKNKLKTFIELESLKVKNKSLRAENSILRSNLFMN